LRPFVGEEGSHRSSRGIAREGLRSPLFAWEGEIMPNREYKDHASVLRFSNILILIFILIGLAGVFYVLTGSGLSGIVALFENVQITSVNCERIYKDETFYWRITILTKNIGVNQVKIISILVEDEKLQYSLNEPTTGVAYTDLPVNGRVISTNEIKIIQISIGYKFLGKTPLDRLRIRIQSDSGKEYSFSLTLT